MAEAPSNTHNKRSLFRTSHVCHRRHAAGRNQLVEEYKHTHTHTHTHTHRANICSWNIGGAFPRYILGIFRKSSL